MAWKCAVEGKELADVRGDRRGAESIEKYTVSGQAVYYEGKYLPISEIRSVRMQPSVYRPNGCCGRGVPVFKIKVEYGGESPVILTIEREKSAEKMMAAICAANPAVEVEEYVDPHTGEKMTGKNAGVF